MEQTEVHGHIIPYQTLVRVWIALLVLTAILVLASRLFHGALSVWAMLILTPIKAGLVFFYFMHLKYEEHFSKVSGLSDFGIVDDGHRPAFFRYFVQVMPCRSYPRLQARLEGWTRSSFSFWCFVRCSSF